MQGAPSQDTSQDNTAPRILPADFSDAIFARRLRALREASGRTQQQLADAMASTGGRIHRSTIGKMESGDRPVTIGEAVELAAILGVDLAELVTDPAPGSRLRTMQEAEREKAHQARVEAQVRLRKAQVEADRRRELMEEAQLLYRAALEVAEDARQQLAALDGEDDQ